MAWGYGYTITDVLNQWQAYGVFAYALPFLLIFAVIFGILSKSKLLGENKGVQATVALAIGLLALQFDLVTNFYATIFPYAGIGIAVLIVALILMGVAADKLSWTPKVWFGLGAIIALVVIFSSLSNFSYFGGGFGFYDSWPAILAGVILFGVMALVIWGGKNS